MKKRWPKEKIKRKISELSLLPMTALTSYKTNNKRHDHYFGFLYVREVFYLPFYHPHPITFLCFLSPKGM